MNVRERINWRKAFCIGYCTAGVDKRVRSTSLYQCRQCRILQIALGSHRLHCRLLYDARLQPKVAKTVPVRAECGLMLATALSNLSTCGLCMGVAYRGQCMQNDVHSWIQCWSESSPRSKTCRLWFQNVDCCLTVPSASQLVRHCIAVSAVTGSSLWKLYTLDSCSNVADSATYLHTLEADVACWLSGLVDMELL